MDEPDDNIYDERDQLTKIMKKKIIEDEETEQMKNLSKTIETSKIKTKNHEEQEAPHHIDEYTKLKILKLQQDNVRPQTIIENHNIIPDKTYQWMNLMTTFLIKEIS